jgi:hypothetical protein
MLKTSLRGQVRQTVLNKYKPLLPLFEAVINAFAIQDTATVQGKLVIEIERERGLGLDDTPPINGFNITDSGIGLNDTNFDSFNTAFSERLIEHVLLMFLQRNAPKVELHDLGQRLLLNQLFEADFRASAAAHTFELSGAPATIHGFRLITPRASRHRLVYAGNSRGVQSDNLGTTSPTSADGYWTGTEIRSSIWPSSKALISTSA